MTNYIKSQFTEFQKEYEAYVQYNEELCRYNALPWYRRIFGTKPTEVKHYSYRSITLSSDLHHSIELRLSFFSSKREMVLAVAERRSNGIYGFKENLIDGIRSSMIGGYYTDRVSDILESKIDNYKKMLAPLIVE